MVEGDDDHGADHGHEQARRGEGGYDSGTRSETEHLDGVIGRDDGDDECRQGAQSQDTPPRSPVTQHLSLVEESAAVEDSGPWPGPVACPYPRPCPTALVE